ncbi:hypothetical protein [Aeoliella sp.]|uniref:hypothetical protein n=1 Tax=Aeoliella sp. TaxID=2795800 RepID=UPI003CCBA753
MVKETIATRRPRFSLLTLVLVTTIVALAVSVAMLYREVRPLRAEVQRLRAEVGELHVGDKAKIHAIHVPSGSKLEWKWRIWIPEGVTYCLRSSGGNIPLAEFPEYGGTMYLREPGEHVIRYVIERDPKRGGWSGKLVHDSGSVGSRSQPWVEWSSWSASGEGVGDATEVFEPDSRVLIARRRYTNEDDPPNDPKGPLPGFMIWLEPR